MFETLSGSLQRVLSRLRGVGKLTESNVKEALREVRVALLEADVHYQVVKDFTNRVREHCMGEAVLDSITPGQQVVKRVHEELTRLLGSQRHELDVSAHPASVLLLGLHGSGKTTTAAKLAAVWKKAGKRVLLVAADIRRPAAVDQLSVLAEQVGVDCLRPERGEMVPALGCRALAAAKERDSAVVLFDTGGRFQIEDELVRELKDLQAQIHARNVVLVLDAALGQESVNVAETFHADVGLTGLILTKLDGDARGGAALSVHAVTGCPVLYIGTGEQIADLEPFHPDRLASRILGMGDIVGLVEKAQETVDAESAAAMARKLRKDSFDFEDFLEQFRQMRKTLPFGKLLEMLPGGANMKAALGSAGGAADLEGFATKAEAIICSMTPKERRHPKLINGPRKRRIAAGSGTRVSEVNDLLRRFQQSRKLMKRMGKGRMMMGLTG